MMKIIVQQFLILFFLIVINLNGYSQIRPIEIECMGGKIIVQFDEDLSSQEIESILRSIGATPLDAITDFNLNLYLICLSNSDISVLDEFINCNNSRTGGLGLSNDSAEDLDNDTVTVQEILIPYHQGRYNPYEYIPHPKCRGEKLNYISKDFFKPVTIAVIDGGITLRLPPFNHLIDYRKAYDFVDNDNSPNEVFKTWHGTRVAGIIAGTVMSMGAEKLIKIIPYKVLNRRGEAEIFNIYKAMVAGIYNADIINLSLGKLTRGNICINIFDAILKIADKENVLVIVAAGNDSGSNIDNTFHQFGSYTNDNLIVVGSNNCNTDISYFSNVGAGNVDLMANGHGVISYPPDKLLFGTSFAAPFVTATAALRGTKMNSFDPIETKCAVLNTTTYQDWDKYCLTGGQLSINDAVAYDCSSNNFSLPINNEPTPANSLQSNSYFSTKDELTLKIQSPIKQEGIIKVYNINGSSIAKASIHLEKGVTVQRLEGFEKYPSGIYFITTLLKGGKITTQKCYKN